LQVSRCIEHQAILQNATLFNLRIKSEALVAKF
jgi:hypothetical protein